MVPFSHLGPKAASFGAFSCFLLPHRSPHVSLVQDFGRCRRCFRYGRSRRWSLASVQRHEKQPKWVSLQRWYRGMYLMPSCSIVYNSMHSHPFTSLHTALQSIRREAPKIGGSFAVWGGLFSTFDCTLVALRKKGMQCSYYYDSSRISYHSFSRGVVVQRIHGTV